MKLEVRGTTDDARRIIIVLGDGTEFDLTEERGELYISAYLDSEDLCVSPGAKNAIRLSVRKYQEDRK